MKTDKHGDPIISEFGRLSPDELLQRLAPRIKRRVELLVDIYNKHFAGFKGIYLNRRLLLTMVESCYCDIYRLKFFRPVEWIDNHKKAAYTMKWIARIRPIQIHSGAQLTTASLMANAWYAAIAGLTLMEVAEGWRDDEWWVRYVRNLAYLLHFHSISVEQLSSELYAVERCSLSQPIPKT